MLVERYSRDSVLDMTWVRFNSIRERIPAMIRIMGGRGVSDEDDCAMQRDRTEWGLPL